MGEALAKNKRKVLGRGLSALISSQQVAVNAKGSGDKGRVSGPVMTIAPGAIASSDQIFLLEIEKIKPNRSQPRQHFKEEELKELAEPIRAHGVLQPILVRAASDTDGSLFEVVAGERRWRAAQLAGLRQLPVIIRDFDDRSSLEVALIENIQRSNLNPVEEARAYQALMDDFGLNQQQLAERVGKERATIANYLRILKLPPELLEWLKSGELSLGHAKAIAAVKEPAAQKGLAKKCVDENLSVRALEDIVARVVVLEPKKRTKKSLGKRGAFPEVTDRLRNKLGTKVTIQHAKSGKGVIEVEYFSLEELDRLVDLIAG